MSRHPRHFERLLQLDALLRTGQRQTIASLAEILETSERTIRSDLAFMRDGLRPTGGHRFDAPLEFDRQKGHYWRLPSISLSKGELFALTLGARMLEAYAGSAYAVELRSAIAYLAERLPEQTWDEHGWLPKYLGIAQWEGHYNNPERGFITKSLEKVGLG